MTSSVFNFWNVAHSTAALPVISLMFAAKPLALPPLLLASHDSYHRLTLLLRTATGWPRLLHSKSNIYARAVEDAATVKLLVPGHQGCRDFGTRSQLRSDLPRDSRPQRTLRSSPSNFRAFRTRLLPRILRKRQKCRLRKSWRCDQTCGHMRPRGSTEVTEGVRRR